MTPDFVSSLFSFGFEFFLKFFFFSSLFATVSFLFLFLTRPSG